MKRILDSNLLLTYIRTFELNLLFQKDMLPYMELFSFDKGELVCTKGTELKYFYFLVDGKLKINTLHDNGKSILLRFYKPLNVVGDIEFLTNLSIQCNVEALNKVTIIAISMDNLRKHVSNDGTFLAFVVRNLSHKLYTISNSTSINLLYPLENRFASYLLSITTDNYGFTDINEIKTSKLTELATLLGTSYRHLNRIINEFISNGIIEKKKGVIIIINHEKLKRLSCGNLYE